MNRSFVKTGAIVAAIALTLGSVATPAFARDGRGNHGGGFHQGGGFGGGSHMGGSFRGNGFQGGGIVRSGGYNHGGWGHNRGYGNGGYYGGYGYGGGYGYNGFGLGLATGVIGGALLANSYPAYGYSADYSSYGDDSQNTVAYCQSRFKSYNVATGTYLGYDGLRHSCP